MKNIQMLVLTGFFVASSTAAALSGPVGVGPTAQLSERVVNQPAEDITSEALIAINALKEAQVRLRETDQAGQPSRRGIYFDLRMGAPAAYEATNMSPRRVFLDFNFDSTYLAHRTRTLGGNKAIKLEYFPTGPNTLVWDITVEVTPWSNELVSVTMFNRPPHPF